MSATITLPIRDILKKEVPFHWDSPQEELFSELKNILSSTPVFTFYYVKKPVIISCDASQSSLGAKPNDPVYMQAGNCWILATVIQKANTPHSYITKTTDGHSYHHYRRHLRTSQGQSQLTMHRQYQLTS